MDTIFLKRASCLLSLAAVTVITSGMSAQAQTAAVKTASTDTTAPSSASALMIEPSVQSEVTSETTAPLVAQVDGTMPNTMPPATTRLTRMPVRQV